MIQRLSIASQYCMQHMSLDTNTFQHIYQTLQILIAYYQISSSHPFIKKISSTIESSTVKYTAFNVWRKFYPTIHTLSDNTYRKKNVPLPATVVPTGTLFPIEIFVLFLKRNWAPPLNSTVNSDKRGKSPLQEISELHSSMAILSETFLI